VLQKAVELVKRGRGVDIDLATVSIENDYPEAKAAYELLARADTVGVFQLESTGMRESLKRLKPDRFEDIIAMVALYRPGPMDNIPTYINRKHGEEPVDCLHPMLEGILKETYGVIIYQEQVIQIAQVMGGYSLGQADLLRRAMGKKDKAEMAKQQARFVEGAVSRGVKKEDAAYIFELVDKFAGYGFNKSHAAAYALVSFHTAYMKANFREEFLAASMTLDLANTDKLAMFAAEARKSGIAVRPPCVNCSDVEFTVEPPQKKGQAGAIRYALAALKNIGTAAVETIVTERSTNGKYADLSDFARRMSPKILNKRNLETMAAGGAFEALEPNRALVHGNAEQMLALANRLASDAAAGTQDLFGGGGATKLDMRPVKMWTPMERLAEECKAIGFYLSGHPLDEYAALLPKLSATPYVEFERRAGLTATAGRLAAIVVSARERRSQKGNKFAFALFTDASGQFEAVIFSDTLAAGRALLEPGTAVLLNVTAEREGETVKIRVESMETLDKAAAGVQRGIKVTIDETTLKRAKGRIEDIGKALKPGGKGEVQVVLKLAELARATTISLGRRFDVSPAVKGEIATLPGVMEIVEL
jgi:DNA polymerase-3 subunit alpha